MKKLIPIVLIYARSKLIKLLKKESAINFNFVIYEFEFILEVKLIPSPQLLYTKLFGV